MQTDIDEIVGPSSIDLSKILTTLRTLCKICSKLPKVYNQWAENLKDHLDRTNNSPIWEKIVEGIL